MQKQQLQLEYTIYENSEELNQELKKLYKLAQVARLTSHSPYSNFKVGAAVLLNNGEIICGSNQENAAYPSGLCAERVTIYAAKSKFPKAAIVALAISTSAENRIGAISPCGGCRQVLSEYENLQEKPFKIIFEGAEKSIIQLDAANDLLPFHFHAKLLNS